MNQYTWFNSKKYVEFINKVDGSVVLEESLIYSRKNQAEIEQFNASGGRFKSLKWHLRQELNKIEQNVKLKEVYDFGQWIEQEIMNWQLGKREHCNNQQYQSIKERLEKYADTHLELYCMVRADFENRFNEHEVIERQFESPKFNVKSKKTTSLTHRDRAIIHYYKKEAREANDFDLSRLEKNAIGVKIMK